MKKWILVMGIVLFSALSYGSEYNPCTSSETQNQTCFTCGETCNIRYSEVEKDDGTTEKILTVSGSGHMGTRNLYGDITLHNDVTKVVVEDGITTVGFNAFYNFRNLREVELPSTLVDLEPGAFQTCPSLTSLVLPDVVNIHRASLQGSGLTSIVIPENAHFNDQDDIFESSLYGSAPLEKIYCTSQQKDACAKIVSYREDDVTVVSYDKKDGVYIIKDENGNDIFYTSAEDMEKNNICQDMCKAQVLKDKGKCGSDAECMAIISAAQSGSFASEGRFYASLRDLLTGNYEKKRIYSIEEANTVSGKKNKVMIRYR